MKHEDILKHYKIAKDAWSKIFADYVEDIRFANGEQWDSKVKSQRDQQSLSSLTYNQLPSKVKYIVNNARSNTPAIKCVPVSDGANPNTAKVYDGIVKYIQYKYNAKHAYINALQNIVIGGIGAWKVVPIINNDEDDDIDVDIAIERILDPTNVLIDPSAKEQNFSDADYCFISMWMSKDQFEAAYPDADSVGMSASNKSMFMKDSVQVLEYWCLNKETECWNQYIINGTDILSENTEYKGKFLPVVFVTGDEVHIEGERIYKGIVRDVKDMQKLLNLSKSRTADYLQRSSNQQWLATKDQISGYEQIWSSTNINGIGVLPYNAGQDGAPQRLEPAAPPAGFMQISQEADADIRAAIGIRDPLQDIPATGSGKAIELQISQGNIGTYEYMDKLNEAIKYTGEILVDLIPQYFNYPHIREIMGLDEQVNTVQLNKPYEENGEIIEHNLESGKYAVIIKKGPSYENQRAEALDKMMEIVKATPEVMQLAGDILFKNMDWEGSQEIADRLRAQIPPNILAASNPTNGDSKSQMQNTQNNLIQMQNQMQMMNDQMQQMQQVIAQLNQEKAAKVTEIQTRGQVDMQLKQMEFEHEKQLKQMDLEGKSKQIAESGLIDLEIADINHTNKVELNLHDHKSDIFKKQLEHSFTASQSIVP